MVRARTLVCSEVCACTQQTQIHLYEHSTCRYVRLNALNVLNINGHCFTAPWIRSTGPVRMKSPPRPRPQKSSTDANLSRKKILRKTKPFYLCPFISNFLHGIWQGHCELSLPRTISSDRLFVARYLVVCQVHLIHSLISVTC